MGFVLNIKLHFWQTSAKVEVDFIVTGPDCFLAIEVKNRTTVHPHDIRGLEIFLQDYPEAQAILLYRGEHRFTEMNVTCLPVEDFLLSVDPNFPLL